MKDMFMTKMLSSVLFCALCITGPIILHGCSNTKDKSTSTSIAVSDDDGISTESKSISLVSNDSEIKIDTPSTPIGEEEKINKPIVNTVSLDNCNKELVESRDELDKVINMNKRLAERLKTQYEKDAQTKSWSRLCLPDEYECLLK